MFSQEYCIYFVNKTDYNEDTKNSGGVLQWK